MKCFNCGQENKDTAKNCKKCGRDLTLPPAWFPDWRWHFRTLAIIYAALIVLFFTAKWLFRELPPPYNPRDIPPEMTPWLKGKPPVAAVPETTSEAVPPPGAASPTDTKKP